MELNNRCISNSSYLFKYRQFPLPWVWGFKSNMSSEKGPSKNERIVFQASIFRGYIQDTIVITRMALYPFELRGSRTIPIFATVTGCGGGSKLLVFFHFKWVPSIKLTYPTKRKGKSSTRKICWLMFKFVAWVIFKAKVIWCVDDFDFGSSI